MPFILSCGKALDEKLVDIRMQFKPTSGNLFTGKQVLPNELVMRVQPDEAIFLRCMTKSPGLSADVASVEMDLTYASSPSYPHDPSRKLANKHTNIYIYIC